MPKMDLLGTYAYQGAYVGPGAGVEVPDNDALIARINEKEARARQRRDAQLTATADTLPAGHPYKTLFAVNNSQPPQYEGDATPAFVPARALKTPPDGFNVSDPDSVDSVLRGLAALGITPQQIQALQASNAAAQVGTGAELPAWTPELGMANSTTPNAPVASTDAPTSTNASPTTSDGEAGSPAPGGSESSTKPEDAGAAPPPAGSASTPANGPRKSSGSSSS